MWKWIALGALVVVLIVGNQMMNSIESTDVEKHSHAMEETGEHEDHEGEEAKPPATPPKKATLEPGRVVELATNRGAISFALFEKDCPKTTARIADLVQKGAYNGVKWPRVEGALIQTDHAKEAVPGMDLEIAEGLIHRDGSVGMARQGNDFRSNTSVFYILKQPQLSLDTQYTVFGRVLYGMDVVEKIKLGDSIVTAQLRPLTDKDRARLRELMATDLKILKTPHP